MQQEKRLGRGLSALLGENKSANKQELNKASNQEFVEQISLSKIVAGIYQPRKHFDQNELKELSDSIKENGVIQPIILRKSNEEDFYEIIAGERRFRASKIAGLNKIPAIVKKVNNHEALELAIIENIQRTDLSVIEEAEGYKQLIDEFSYTQEQIAKKTGKSRSHITNILRLLTLPKSVSDLLDRKMISMGHARAIISSEDPEKFAKLILDESLTVRDIEELVRKEKEVKETKPNKRKVKLSAHQEQCRNMQEKLVETLKTKVRISFDDKQSSGRIVIECDSFNKLQQIYQNLKSF